MVNVTRTDVGPLTTIFTPAASCQTETSLSLSITRGSTKLLGDYGAYESCSNTKISGTPMSMRSALARSGCYPNAMVTMASRSAQHQFDNWDDMNEFDMYQAVFSPGYYCPSGFNIATSYVQNKTPDGLPQSILPDLRPTEEAAICCPNNFQLMSTRNAALCIQTLAPSAIVTGVMYNCTVTSRTMATIAATQTDAIIMATPVVLVIKQGQKIPEQTAGSDSSSGGGGLSQGAKIAIGVTIPVVVLLLLGVGAFFFLKKRKQRANYPESHVNNTGNVHDHSVPEMSAVSSPTVGKHELGQNTPQVNMLDSSEKKSNVSELGHNAPAVNMLDSRETASPAAEMDNEGGHRGQIYELPAGIPNHDFLPQPAATGEPTAAHAGAELDQMKKQEEELMAQLAQHRAKMADRGNPQ